MEIGLAFPLEGEPCPQTAVVLSRSTGPVAYLLDTRRLVTASCSFQDLRDIFLAANIDFPAGRRGDLLSSRVCGLVQVLRIGETVELAHAIFSDLLPAVDEALPGAVSLSTLPPAISASGTGALCEVSCRAPRVLMVLSASASLLTRPLLMRPFISRMRMIRSWSLHPGIVTNYTVWRCLLDAPLTKPCKR